MKLKRPIVVLGAAVAVMLATVGVAASAAEPAPAYGGCVNKNTGYLRVLERNALTKSVNGKCRSTERKISWYSRSGGKGPKGDTGAAGSAGLSAYQVWLAQPGNASKTEAQYLASLKGDTGAQGPKGDAGPAGPAPAELVLVYKGTTINCVKGSAATLTYECADAS